MMIIYILKFFGKNQVNLIIGLNFYLTIYFEVLLIISFAFILCCRDDEDKHSQIPTILLMDIILYRDKI